MVKILEVDEQLVQLIEAPHFAQSLKDSLELILGCCDVYFSFEFFLDSQHPLFHILQYHLKIDNLIIQRVILATLKLLIK